MRALLDLLAGLLNRLRGIGAGTVLHDVVRVSLIRDEHSYSRCTYSYYYGMWVRTCSHCGRVLSC
jgi:hypothetical protein